MICYEYKFGIAIRSAALAEHLSRKELKQDKIHDALGAWRGSGLFA